MKKHTLLVMAFVAVAHVCIAQEQVLSLWTINPGTPFGNLTDRFARQYSEQHPEVQLKSVHFPNNYYKYTLHTALEGGNLPDIFQNWGVNSLKAFVERNNVIDLGELKHHLQQVFLPVAFDPVTFDGKIYGVPYSGLAGVFFWYRKDIFAKLNLQPPRTWQEFLRVGRILQENDIIPIALANKNKWPGSFFYMYLVDRIGGPDLFSRAFNGDGASFVDPAFIDAGEHIQQLVRENFFPSGFNRAPGEPGNWNSLFISGKAGMYLMGSWFASTLNNLPEQSRRNFDFFRFPLIEGGKGSITSLIGSPGQDYLSVSAASPNRQAAFAFLGNYIATNSYFEELAKQGMVPPVQHVEKYLSDPISLKVAKAFREAEHVQIYYDQIMPSTMAEAHKLLVHQLFELRLSGRQVAEEHQQLFQRWRRSTTSDTTPQGQSVKEAKQDTR